MIYKKFDQLSGYLIAPDATVIEIETYEVVKPEKVLTGWGVKLLTDEVPASFKGSRKPLQLVRTFSKEDLLKMYARSKTIWEDDMCAIPYTKAVQLSSSGSVMNGSSTKPSSLQKVSTEFHEAVLEGKPSADPVVNSMKEAFMSEATEITPEMMARLSSREPLPVAEVGSLDHAHDVAAASKRVVKRNPKSKPSDIVKVAKAIKASKIKQVDDSGMKIPYIKIDGVPYQSARKAAEATKLSVNTVLKKAKANADGWFYIEA